MEESRVSATRDCYATALRKASRRMTALYDDVLEPSGLRSTQYAILRELAAGGSLTINELARVLVLDRSGLGHSLRPLERGGLISLGQSPSDRRSVLVTLTEKGKRQYGEASVLWRSVQDQVGSLLGAAVADQLREQLNELASDERLG
ncbi:MarR family winged helix-turn-helix transcriptional regulator [Pseudonocardia spinosispora]|uniref:MarR family winged helix-turn-helix transcriptional regulator n=1 Tax=Pseudonocardia spinosispora TaxID=103441 RepID=UPI00040C8BD8|nr:MarR family transcriptional regulator [Pseudonocardia spinosispora]